MDHHVAEEATGASEIGEARRRWIAARQEDYFRPTDLAFTQLALKRSETRIKAAIEGHEQDGAARFYNLQNTTDSTQILVDRFFAENRLSGSGRRLNQFRVSLSWARYGNDVYIPVRENLGRARDL